MPQRLAFVIHDLCPWGGQERCTFEIARRLSHRWPVDIYAFTFERAVGAEGAAGWGDVTFHRVRPFVRRPVLLKSTLFYAETLPRLLAARRGEHKVLVHTAGACALRADVVQVHFVHAAYKARFAKEPMHRRAIEGLYHAANDHFNLLLERDVFRRAGSFVAVSRRVASELATHFGITSNVSVVRHGVDADEFHPPTTDEELADRLALRKQFGFSDEDVVILLIGVNARKGLSTLIRAVAALPRSIGQRTKILAVGRGEGAPFQTLATKLGVADRLTILGPTRNAARYYRVADLFALPTHYDPFGLVVLEAMATGLPVVVSACAGAAELLTTNGPARAGATIEDPLDHEQLATALGPFISDDEQRKHAGAAARACALTRSWDVVASEYVEVLMPLMHDAS